MNIHLNRELFKSAVEIPSPATDRLCEAARKADAYVAMGLNERRPGAMPGTLYNTMLFIHRNGTIMGKHQKLMPTFIEKIVHAIGDGSTLQVFPTEYGPLVDWPVARTATHSCGSPYTPRGRCTQPAGRPTPTCHPPA